MSHDSSILTAEERETNAKAYARAVMGTTMARQAQECLMLIDYLPERETAMAALRALEAVLDGMRREIKSWL